MPRTVQTSLDGQPLRPSKSTRLAASAAWTETNKRTPRDAFLEKKAQIDEGLARLKSLSSNYFELHPDEINWSDVGTLTHYAELLKHFTDAASKKVNSLSNNHQLRSRPMTAPIFTTFDRGAMPVNLLTVAEWRHFSTAVYKGVGWLSAARKYAACTGGAIVLRADDSLIVFTRHWNGSVTRRTYKPRTWGWAN